MKLVHLDCSETNAFGANLCKTLKPLHSNQTYTHLDFLHRFYGIGKTASKGEYQFSSDCTNVSRTK